MISENFIPTMILLSEKMSMIREIHDRILTELEHGESVKSFNRYMHPLYAYSKNTQITFGVQQEALFLPKDYIKHCKQARACVIHTEDILSKYNYQYENAAIVLIVTHSGDIKVNKTKVNALCHNMRNHNSILSHILIHDWEIFNSQRIFSLILLHELTHIMHYIIRHDVLQRDNATITLVTPEEMEFLCDFIAYGAYDCSVEEFRDDIDRYIVPSMRNYYHEVINDILDGMDTK